MSSQVLVNQWNNLVQTLVATVIADKPAAEKASDAELSAIAKRLTAVSSNLAATEVYFIAILRNM